MMSSPIPPSPSQVSPSRSTVITVVGCLFILLGALLMPVSGISFLMILARSYGTANTDVVGFLTIVVAPPATFVVGIGLLRRRPWAWYGAVTLLTAVIALNVWELATARTTTTTYTSPSGTRTTVLASGPNQHSLPLIAISSLVIMTFLLPSIRSELGVSRAPRPITTAGIEGNDPIRTIAPTTNRPESDPDAERDWRVGHRGRDNLYYEERHFGRWQRIEIGGEMLTGRAHHVIYFPAPDRWQSYPEWARYRRSEIIERIKSALQPSDYEYFESGTNGSHAVPVPSAPPALPPPAIPTPTISDHRAVVLAIVLLLAIATGVGWAVKQSLEDGTTVLNVKQARISASREDEPVMFWLAVAIQSTVAVGTGGLALCLIFYGLRRSSSAKPRG